MVPGRASTYAERVERAIESIRPEYTSNRKLSATQQTKRDCQYTCLSKPVIRLSRISLTKVRNIRWSQYSTLASQISPINPNSLMRPRNSVCLRHPTANRTARLGVSRHVHLSQPVAHQDRRSIGRKEEGTADLNTQGPH